MDGLFEEFKIIIEDKSISDSYNIASFAVYEFEKYYNRKLETEDTTGKIQSFVETYSKKENDTTIKEIFDNAKQLWQRKAKKHQK